MTQEASPKNSAERTYWATWHDQTLVTVELMTHECQDEIILWPVTDPAPWLLHDAVNRGDR